MTGPILYSFRRCPYAMRARSAILVARVPVELREVVLRNKPAELLNASPKATVPVLVLPDGTVIDESLDVMHWALDQADPEDWLDVDASTSDALIAHCDGPFKHHLDRFKYADRHPDEDVGVHRDGALAFLTLLEAQLADRPYLTGEQPRITDHAIMPFVRQFVAAAQPWFATAPFPHLRAWLARLMETPHFAEVMTRFPPWISDTSGPRFGDAASS